jgi:hypothetical protein
MARLSCFEVLKLILALMNCRVVVAKFLELVAVAGLTELPATEGQTAKTVAMMVVVVEIAALHWTWFRVHELWLPEIRAKLVRH